MDTKKETENGRSAASTRSPAVARADAGLLFSIAAILPLVVEIFFSAAIYLIAAAKGVDANEYVSSLRGNFGFTALSYGLSSVSLLLSVLVFSAIRRQRPFRPVPFVKFRPKYLIVAFLLAFGMLFGFPRLNDYFLEGLGKLGYSKPDLFLPNEKAWQLCVWLVLVAALPAFLEECLFRGYIAEGMKGLNAAFVCLFGGLLFSLFHTNPQQTPYQFVCGAAFFLIALKSGSVLPCILMHFTNNAVILLMDFFHAGEFGTAATIVLTVLGLLAFAGGIVYLAAFDKKSDGERAIPEENRLNQTKTPLLLYSFVGIAACVILWMVDFISYGGFSVWLK